MPVEDKAEKGDYLASAIIGMNRAIQGSINTALNPIDTAKGLAAALRNPKQTAKAVAADFKADPVQTMAELLMPMPGPKGAKPRKIVVPEKLALDHELNALRAAAKELDEPRYIKPQKKKIDGWTEITDEADRARWQEDFMQNFGGWYPGEDYRLRKDIGPVDVRPEAFNARRRSKFQLADILRHPSLMARLANTGRELPTFIRDAHDPMVGGGYWDGMFAGGRLTAPEVRVGGKRMNDFMDTVNHEVQHVVQDFGDLREPYTGSSPSRAGSVEAYLQNPGEMEARIAGLRSRMTPGQRQRNSFPAMYQKEREFLRSNESLKRPMALWEHLRHEINTPEANAEFDKALKDIKF